MIERFTDGRAVVMDQSTRNPLWLLEEPRRTKAGTYLFDYIDTYPTRAIAERLCKHMGFPAHHVTRIRARFGFVVYAIKYDYRYPYFLATWDCPAFRHAA